jgi:hypothetical protein
VISHMASRPYIATGAVLASAALIAAATPVILPVGEATKVAAMVPAPPELSTIPYSLAAVTLDELLDAYYNGYGEQVTDNVTVSGVSGVLYYVVDTQLAANTDLDNYFFEVSPGYAVEQALYETFGSDSAIGQAVNLIWNPQSVVSTGVINAAESAFGADSVIANAFNYYFNGYGDTATGVPSVVHYLIDTLSAAITSATSTTATTTATAATTVAAATVAATTTATATSATAAAATATTAVAETATTAATVATADVDTAATASKAAAQATAATAAVPVSDAVATPAAASAAAADTTATTTASASDDNPLVRLSKSYSPSLKTDSTIKPFKAASEALKNAGGHAEKAASSSESSSKSGASSVSAAS